SVIQSNASQEGPTGLRTILGPFHFVNHDCSPNCQIFAIPRSNACTIISVKPIPAGQTITVSYTESGYHDADSACGCASCNPSHPPGLPLSQNKSSNPR
ncbi:hypothetical protein OF83DRAFT_1034483, partial [Amylostereum chailletii]